jgi:hypothetical protein
MRSNQALKSLLPWTELGSLAPVQKSQFIRLDDGMVERGARALFEFVFAGTQRLDGKHLWANGDDEVKAGFRAEARTVLEAALRQIEEPARHSDGAKLTISHCGQ